LWLLAMNCALLASVCPTISHAVGFPCKASGRFPPATKPYRCSVLDKSASRRELGHEPGGKGGIPKQHQSYQAVFDAHVDVTIAA
jgi:hypothetical protein